MKVKWIVTASATLPLLILTAPAGAVGVGGWAGNGIGAAGAGNIFNTSNGDGCFAEDYGAAIYLSNPPPNCPGGWEFWEVPLQVNSGSYNPTVGVAWPITGPYGGEMEDYIACSTVSQSQLHTGSAFESTGFVTSSSSAGSNGFQPGSVTVPNDGFLFVVCEMREGAGLISVNY
jgi:hypothetical protein